MTSYINRTIAGQHVAELISQAEQGRLRRELRRARRARRAAERTARSDKSWRGPSNSSLRVPGRIGLVGIQ